jgi:hypothetical protein
MTKFITKLMLTMPEDPIEELSNKNALADARNKIQKLEEENSHLKLELGLLKINNETK